MAAITFAERRTLLQGIQTSVKALYDLNERASALTTSLSNADASDEDINAVLVQLCAADDHPSSGGAMDILRDEIVEALQGISMYTEYSSS